MYELRRHCLLGFFVLTIAVLTSLSSLLAQTAQEKEGSQNAAKLEAQEMSLQTIPETLNIKQILQLLIRHNSQLQVEQLEFIKTDAEQRRNDSKYNPILEFGGNWGKEKRRYTNSFTSGDTTGRYNLFAKAKKNFITGSHFETALENSNVSSEEIENTQLNAFGDGIFTPAKLNTSRLKVLLRQELLKNAFGYNNRREKQILHNRTSLQKQRLTYALTQATVEAIVNFWQVAIHQGNIKTTKELLKSNEKLRSITLRQSRLGLAEKFELKQWEALIATTKNRLQQATLQRDIYWRSLLATVNVDPRTPIVKPADLITTRPTGLNPEKDLQVAYKNRPDLKAARLERENALMQYQIAKNQLLPSLALDFSYTGQGFDSSLGEALQHSIEAKYPDYRIGLNLQYPLWNDEATVNVRSAKVDLLQAEIREKQLVREIRDNVELGIQTIQTLYENLLNADTAYKATRSYYLGLTKGYRKGRFTSFAVKNAQDSLVEARQSHLEAIINYNIQLLRYDLTRNVIFQKYDIDVDQVIKQMYTRLP